MATFSGEILGVTRNRTRWRRTDQRDISITSKFMATPTGLSNKRFRLWLASRSQSNLTRYNPADSDPLGPGMIQFSPIFLSAQYNTERWSLTSEYALRHFKYSNFNNPGFDSLDFYGESYYFQGVYRFTPQWEALLRYDVLYTDRSDRSGKAFAAARGGAAHSRFAKDVTAGLRWNVTPSFMLRVEYHRVNGTAWLSTLDNPNSADTINIGICTQYKRRIVFRNDLFEALSTFFSRFNLHL